MIKMKALRSFGYAGVNEGSVRRGTEFSARDEQRVKELEAHGLAYRLPAAKAEPKLLNKMDPPLENKASREGPLPSVGGETGADNAQSSLLPDHPQQRRRSRRSKAEQESSL